MLERISMAARPGIKEGTPKKTSPRRHPARTGRIPELAFVSFLMT